MKPCTLFNEQKGSAILQAMLVVVLMGTSSITMMNLYENNSRAERGVSVGYQVASLMEEIKTLLSDQTACTNSLENGVIYPPPVTPVTFSDLKTKFDITKFAVNGTYRDGMVKIKSIELGPFQGDPSISGNGTAELKIILEKQGNVFGGNTIARTLDLQVGLNDDPDPLQRTKVAACLYGTGVAGSSGTDTVQVQAMFEEGAGGQCFESAGTCTGGYELVSEYSRNRCTVMETTAGGRFHSFLTNGNCDLGFVAQQSIGNYRYYSFGVYMMIHPETVKVCCRKPIVAAGI